MTPKEELLKRHEQAVKDRDSIDANIRELDKQIEAESKPKQPKFGDIVSTPLYKGIRVVLYDKDGKLRAFDLNGCPMDLIFTPEPFYQLTGANLFTDRYSLKLNQLISERSK